jgi:hypothetical protein
VTVAEMIAALQTLPQDARVVIIDNWTHDDPTPYPVQALTEYEPGEITIEY